MVKWDWGADPAYESERICIDRTLSPIVFFDMKEPRLVEDDEIALMLSAADYHLECGLPFVGLVRHERGTGIVAARHRKAFADWLEARGDALQRDDFAVVIVVPEAIYRAVLRVVYRFRAPLLRTTTAPDIASAAEATRAELGRMGVRLTLGMEDFLTRLAPNRRPSSA